jgi:hypothetical protein
MTRDELNIKSTLPEKCCLGCENYRYGDNRTYCNLIDKSESLYKRYIYESDVCDYFEKVKG